MKNLIPWLMNDGGKGKSSFPNEKLDCVIRALTIYTDRSYDDIHSVAGSFGRTDGHKCYHTIEVMQSLGLTVKYERMTLKKFVTIHPKGRYVCHIRGHLFTIIDGIIQDIYGISGLCRIDWYGIKEGDGNINKEIAI